MSALARFGIVVGTAALGISMYRPKREPRGKMETVAGKTVLVTGAAQGLGRLFATKAVDEKAGHVILWDVDRKGLTKTMEDLTNRGGKVSMYVVDVSKFQNISEAADKVRNDVGAVNVLVNNAGIVRGKVFWENDPVRDIGLTMNVNAIAPMYITREFLPSMMDSAQPCRIVNIASAAGLTPTPTMAVYGGSKAAALNWSESLRVELVRAGYGHVQVTTVCPAFIDTGMFQGVKAPLFTPLLTPDGVVDAAWAGMLEGQPLVKMPWTVPLSGALRGILSPHAFDLIAGRFFGVYSAMDAWEGKYKQE